MQNIQLNSNRWDNIYSKIPNFENFNNFLTLNKASAPVAIALSAMIAGERFYPDSSALINRVALWSCAAVVGTKGLLMVGSYIQQSIWSKTTKAKELKTWGLLAPPTDPQITDHRIRYQETQERIEDSFPEAVVFKRLADHDRYQHVPQPTAYTLNQLQNECEQWMKDSLAIANAVCDDLKKWSDSNRFNQKNGELLAAQPGWHGSLHSSPWLYRGFFLLPVAYRTIFNLPDGISQLKDLKPGIGKKEADDFEKSYPDSNKAAIEGWKAKFFEPGTQQYQWREQYNAAMGKILELAGEIPDTRFGKWSTAHKDGDFKFRRSPDTLPT